MGTRGRGIVCLGYGLRPTRASVRIKHLGKCQNSVKFLALLRKYRSVVYRCRLEGCGESCIMTITAGSEWHNALTVVQEESAYRPPLPLSRHADTGETPPQEPSHNGRQQSP